MTIRRARHWPSITGNAEQRASNSLTRLEDITRMVAEWVWEIDHDGYITFISERVTEDIGFLPLHLIGKKFTELGIFLERTIEMEEPNWKQPFRDIPFSMIDINGKERRLLFSGIPTFDRETGKHTGMCGTTRDTSRLRDLKAAERKLAKVNNMLREATLAKSSFLANMSHELRTPLNAIIGFSQIMKNEMFGALGNRKYYEYSSDIYNSGQHLLNMVNDVLDLSRVEAGELDLREETIDLPVLIDSCLTMVSPSAESSGVSLASEVEAKSLYADSRLTQQMLLNLLSNAIKFTPHGGDVKMTTSLTESGGITIKVIDTGIGIPKESFKKILVPFGQVENSNETNAKGIGLGLAITKSFVEKHGGKINLESELGVGTTIAIEFPPERTLPNKK